MADLTDPQRYGEKLTNQLQKLHDADIADADRERILEFVRHLDGSNAVNTGTIVSRLNRLRLTSERADAQLLEMKKSDVDAFLFELNHEYDLSEGTVRNYRKALRAFFEYDGRDWYEDIHIGASPERSVDPNDLLSMEEINDLLDTAGTRDKALIGILADAGLRIGAVASLRVGDVEFEGPTATVTVNENANVKGASGATPLTWSEGYVANWLNVHPRREPDAPLFHVTEGWYDPDENGDGSLDYQYLSRRIRSVAEKAAVDPDRVNTHNFRKSAISRWIREGMSEQAIKHRAHWDVDTDQFDTYSGVRDEELNDQIREHYGLEATEDERPDLDNCDRCGVSLSGGEAFCPGCANALTDRAAARAQAVEDTTFEDTGRATGGDVDDFGEFRRRFNNDPAFRRRVAGAADHDDSSS